MQWAFLAIATIAVIELLARLNVAATTRRLLDIVRNVARILKSDHISDHWKERVLPIYAGQLLVASLTLLGMLLLAMTPVIVFAAVDPWTGVAFLTLLLDSRSIWVSLAIASAYLWLRRHLTHV